MSALTAMSVRPMTKMNTSEESKPKSPKTTQTWAERWLGLEPWNPRVIAMARAVEGFCGAWYRNKPNAPRLLVLAGRSGCGKTRAMRGAHRYVRAARVVAAEHGHWAWPADEHWCQWPEAASLLTSGRTVSDSMDSSISTDVLFLDDIGAESDKYRSGETIDALCQLLSRRERRWTMVTTNYLPEEWPARFDARVADRLLRDSMVCDMRGCGSYSMRAA